MVPIGARVRLYRLAILLSWPLCSLLMKGRGSLAWDSSHQTSNVQIYSRANLRFFIFFVCNATQLVILPPHIPRVGQGGGGILLLCYSMICVIGLTIFYLKWEGEY